jgi:MFS superfamily sulfate permease-like transporter
MNSVDKPLDGIDGLKQNWKSDIVSGFIVFLIALPLCIGIALASGAPPMAGLFAGIVGGILASLLGGSYLTINGPAAGMIAVVISSITVLGNGDNQLGFELTLAAVCIAGGIQILLGILKAGNLSLYFPGSVIHGMMAAIGIIIISKQAHTLLGVSPESKTIIGLLTEIPQSISKFNPHITFIGIISLLILIILPLINNKIIKKIPPPLIVVLLGVALAYLLNFQNSHNYFFLEKEYTVGPKSLVTLPDSIIDGINKPNFSKVLSFNFILMTITITLIASIEALLTSKAIDKLDPYKRITNMDKELIAKGASNMLLGFIGGLPIIAEVVRSSANVNNGAKTRWSNFFHGIFLLIFVALFPKLLHYIPLTCLSAILILVGLKLASPSEFKHTYEKGKDQIIVFLVTIIITLAEDLLLGVLAGIIVKIIILLYYGLPFNRIFKAKYEINSKNKSHTFTIYDTLVFTNYLSIKRALYSLPIGESVKIVLKDVKVIGHTTMEYLDDFINYYQDTNGTVSIEGLDDLVPVSSHPLSTRKINK